MTALYDNKDGHLKYETDWKGKQDVMCYGTLYTYDLE